MIKEEFIGEVCQKIPYSHAMVTRIVDVMLETITREIADGNSVQFAGFGTFEPKYRAARTGRNPHTNEPVPIPARIVPNFRAGKFFKEAVVKQVK